MHATDIDFSPGKPSFSVTTRWRFTPHGISCSCLHAVTQPLHSMQRSASHRNFILAMRTLRIARSHLLYLTQRGLGFLHHRHDVVAVGTRGVDRLAADVGCRPLRVVLLHVLTLPPPGEVERQEH